MQNFLFTQSLQVPLDRNLVQSTPMVHAPISRISSLPMAFQLSPIVHHENSNSAISKEQDKSDLTTDINFTSKEKSKNHSSKDIFETTDSSPIDLSTWIGGIYLSRHVSRREVNGAMAPKMKIFSTNRNIFSPVFKNF